MSISFAVMLPVGNPPNAIVFSYGHCQIKDMVSYGCPLPGPVPRGQGWFSVGAFPGASYFIVGSQHTLWCVERLAPVKRFLVGGSRNSNGLSLTLIGKNAGTGIKLPRAHPVPWFPEGMNLHKPSLDKC
jgi:hypothetical protein